MNIGSNIYLDIRVKGSNKKNFISAMDAIDFQIIETSGASLPYIYAKFSSGDPEITKLFQLNNKVIVKMGVSENQCDSFEVTLPFKPQINKDSVNKIDIIELAGFIGNIVFMTGAESATYKGNSLQVVNKIIKKYLGHGIINSMQAKDKATSWMQLNQTANQFLADVITHADLRPSFPLFSFDKYLNFRVLDNDSLNKEGAKYTFTPYPVNNSNTIQYSNNFNISDYSNMYNHYSGFNKMTEVYDVNKGVCQHIINKNLSILGESSEVEQVPNTGNLIQSNVIQSSNVHSTYYSSFTYNTNKLVSLSTMLGAVEIIGRYVRELHPLDLINLISKDSSYNGLYIVDTIVTKADFKKGTIHTYVYLTRDNKNNVENYIVEKKQKIKVLDELKNKILSTVADLKNAYAFGLRVLDGTYMQELLSFAITTKTNILRSFSALRVTLDLTSQKNALTSLICMGNNLMNLLCDMIFPENIASVLHDFIISNRSLKSLLSDYIASYVPVEVRDIIARIAELLFDTTDSLNSIAKDNNIDVTAGGTVATTEDTTDTTDKSQQRVSNIISEFEENTNGVDIPFPIIDLTESQELYSDEQLKDYMATETINNLTDLGYMNGVDADELKEVLLGNSKISFELIKAINNSAGNNYSYRYYGTFNSELELVDYYIKKGFKDKYRTLPCTKLINATQNARIFFACPSREDNVKIYINSKRIDLPSFEIDLGSKDDTGAIIKYTVYYTEDGYNSNSVLFEVKQGGMV